ncbi:yeats-domain-containing protein [Cryphonectria parasitica EP155]|uniref:Protein AF-9 homolog n=1 Tax=Cryphonectria parasitica (strain ATCC 38755 / EP155) TaxID=660469 RepID=A0A9P5CTD1_CRYP1|nr:yeats-domain-containing protein [Cryphonectria parasitica EP155]KAF3770524.1 yeats-domain-containing protein [Cryphonectria parasitica EP155]
MAPSSAQGKRVKGRQVSRPFVYGTTARPFDPEKNPKPSHVPDDHTHSWTVFVKGVDDTDLTYWLRRVQFKLHESIPNHVRMVDGQHGRAFLVEETGWGEFEIAIKLYYVPESGEKPQTLYHHLRLHAYGSDAERAAMVANGEVVSWVYEEQLFNEPFEHFFDILTSGAGGSSSAGGGKGKGGGAAGGAQSKDGQPKRTEGGVIERSAMIPMRSRPGQPFSAEAEKLEMDMIRRAMDEVRQMREKDEKAIEEMTAKLVRLKEEGRGELAMAA